MSCEILSILLDPFQLAIYSSISVFLKVCRTIAVSLWKHKVQGRGATESKLSSLVRLFPRKTNLLESSKLFLLPPYSSRCSRLRRNTLISLQLWIPKSSFTSKCFTFRFSKVKFPIGKKFRKGLTKSISKKDSWEFCHFLFRNEIA